MLGCWGQTGKQFTLTRFPIIQVCKIPIGFNQVSSKRPAKGRINMDIDLPSKCRISNINGKDYRAVAVGASVATEENTLIIAPNVPMGFRKNGFCLGVRG